MGHVCNNQQGRQDRQATPCSSHLQKPSPTTKYFSTSAPTHLVFGELVPEEVYALLDDAPEVLLHVLVPQQLDVWVVAVIPGLLEKN